MGLMKKLSIIISILLLSCSAVVAESNEPKKEEIVLDYQLVNHIEFELVFSQSEEQYCVYFYSKTCGHCELLKSDIISFALEDNEPFYFVDFTDLHFYGSKKDLTGVSSIEDFYIFGTPFLIVINNRAIIEYYYGVNLIREYIASKKSQS